MDRIGRYKIVRELGRGAMGVVYHAIDPNIGRPVAIKTIHLGGGGGSAEQERMRERLFREARSAGILSHPGIVTIYDVDQQGDFAFIAMEYVDGPTLDHVLSAGTAPDPAKLFSILGQTAVALDYAHQKGIVHRDIKPANIMITADGTAKVADFGIAKITASEQFTMTGSIVGTPHYMSPEQVQGQEVDGRADQFSLAVIAYEMLTGDKPFTGEHLTTVVYKIVADEPLAAGKLNPTLSSAIESTLRKGLAKKPDARFRGCQEFVEALEKACAASPGWRPAPLGGGLNEPTLAIPAAGSRELPPLPRSRATAAGTTTEEDVHKSRFGFLSFLLIAIGAAAVLALIGWQMDPNFPERWHGISTSIKAALGKSEPSSNMGAATANQPPAQQGAPASNSDAKPSPMPPVAAPAPETTPDQTAPAASAPETPQPPATEQLVAPARPLRPAAPQRVSFASSPAGASVTLLGHPELSCQTPCALPVPPGRYVATITLAGYIMERRDVQVGLAPVEVPPVVLRAPSGTLALTTVPDGASVLIDGKRIQQTTPATIPLPPGNYAVTIEKGGKQASSQVEIRNGVISYLRIVLDQ